MMKVAILLLVLSSVTALYTSSFWAKKGINVKDGILEQSEPKAIYLSTSCKVVDLSKDPYNHNGMVWTGYLNVNKGGSGLGFMLYGKEGASVEQILETPFVLWLNGGPGSSSQLGNFMELGPYFLKSSPYKPIEIVKNNYTWIKNFNVIFVDQPIGTGLSWADPAAKNPYCTSMEEVANDFYYALKELYLSPNGCFNLLGVKPSHPLVIFGESYAGKYAPAIGEKIMREMQDNKGFLTGLKGVALGDGFTNPYEILTEAGEFAFNMGLLDYQERMTVEHVILNATYQQHRLMVNNNITERNQLFRDLHDSFDLALDLIVELSGNVNVYDITKYYPYPDEIVGSYLSSDDVKTLYHLNKDINFGEQSANVYEEMYIDFMMPYPHLVEEMLRRGLQVMVYNGQNDLIVETPGTFKWVERLHYAHAEQFRDTLMTQWKVNDVAAGFYKSVGNLELRTVNNAGHLVPMDQGEFALALVNDFVKKSLKP